MSSPPPIPTPAQGPYSSPQVTIVLTVILLVFFFVGFFSVFFCRCIAENMRLSHPGPNSRPSATQTAASSGLDVQIIQTFPMFKYSAVKDLRKGEIELECAICLSEFLDDDFLRLLTVCNHVFHQECVDLWLESHKTCPVCRTALDGKSTTKVSDSENNTPANELHHSHNGSDGSVRISIKENHDEENEIQSAPINTSSVAININEDGIRNARSNVEVLNNKRREIAEKFSRCHSTGHSIFRNKVEDLEKYTLRLPDHVKEEITKGHHQWAKSCTNIGEYSTSSAKHGNGFGEMSGTFRGDDDKV